MKFIVYLFLLPATAQCFIVLNSRYKGSSVSIIKDHRLFSHESRCPRASVFMQGHSRALGNPCLTMALELDPVSMLPESNLLDVRQQTATKGFVYNNRSTAKMGAIFLMAIAVLANYANVEHAAQENVMRTLTNLWNGYEMSLHSDPVRTKAFTSATVYAIGDVISQKTEGKSFEEIDASRTLRSLTAGMIGHGPLSHVWYNWAESFFTDTCHLTQWWSLFPKVALDQTLWGPIWNNCYILLLGIMQLTNPKTIVEEMKQTTIPLIVAGLKLWPLAHCVTYSLPVDYRLVWVDLVEIIWVTILATAAAGASGHGSAQASTQASAQAEISLKD